MRCQGQMDGSRLPADARLRLLAAWEMGHKGPERARPRCCCFFVPLLPSDGQAMLAR